MEQMYQVYIWKSFRNQHITRNWCMFRGLDLPLPSLTWTSHHHLVFRPLLPGSFIHCKKHTIIRKASTKRNHHLTKELILKGLHSVYLGNFSRRVQSPEGQHCVLHRCLSQLNCCSWERSRMCRKCKASRHYNIKQLPRHGMSISNK